MWPHPQTNPAQRRSRLRGISLLLGTLLSASQVGAATVEDGITQFENEWELIRYETPAADREKRYEALANGAHKLGLANPGRAEPLIWEGIALSSQAGEKGGLGALPLAMQAKALFEESIRIDGNALQGAASSSLGVLYYRVPAWPISFGDRNRAAELLLKSLAVNAQSVDNNFYYGEFLVETGHPQEAVPFLERALNIPTRPGKQTIDTSHREEVWQLLEKARHH